MSSSIPRFARTRALVMGGYREADGSWAYGLLVMVLTRRCRGRSGGASGFSGRWQALRGREASGGLRAPQGSAGHQNDTKPALALLECAPTPQLGKDRPLLGACRDGRDTVLHQLDP